jgi:hypothetical protein
MSEKEKKFSVFSNLGKLFIKNPEDKEIEINESGYSLGYKINPSNETAQTPFDEDQQRRNLAQIFLGKAEINKDKGGNVSILEGKAQEIFAEHLLEINKAEASLREEITKEIAKIQKKEKGD